MFFNLKKWQKLLALRFFISFTLALYRGILMETKEWECAERGELNWIAMLANVIIKLLNR